MSDHEERISALERRVFGASQSDIAEREEYWENYEDEDEEEREWEEELDMAASCWCGAWQINSRGDVVHVADCCCGNGL